MDMFRHPSMYIYVSLCIFATMRVCTALSVQAAKNDLLTTVRYHDAVDPQFVFNYDTYTYSLGSSNGERTRPQVHAYM